MLVDDLSVILEKWLLVFQKLEFRGRADLYFIKSLKPCNQEIMIIQCKTSKSICKVMKCLGDFEKY